MSTKIGTIEPNWAYVNALTNEEAKETLAFIKGAFDKYTEDIKDEYTDMNQDLCNYTRKMLKIFENEIKK